MNFARLNHVLIPQDGLARMAWLQSRKGIVLRVPLRIYVSLTGLGRFLLGFWIISGFAGLNMARTMGYVVSAAVSGLMLASLLLRQWCRMSDVRVSVSCPPRVTVFDEILFTVRAENRGSREYNRVEVEPPFLTWDGRMTTLPDDIPFLGPEETRSVLCRARFTARGPHCLMPFSVRQKAPLGIMTGTPVPGSPVQFLVLPRVPFISRLDLPGYSSLAGHDTPKLSASRDDPELVGVREYRPGDRFRDIHAGTFARTGEPYVREYHQPYFPQTCIILDTDMTSDDVGEREFEAAVSLAAGCLQFFRNAQSMVDILVTGEDVHSLRIGGDLGDVTPGLDLLATVQPGNSIPADSLQQRISPFIHSLSAMVIICLSCREAHREMDRWVRQHGIPLLRCKVQRSVTSDESIDNHSHVRIVTPSRIFADEALVL